MMINGKHYTEPELQAYVKDLERFAAQRDKDAKEFGRAWQEMSDKVKELECGHWVEVSKKKPETGEMVIIACYGSDIIIPDKGESIGECVARLQHQCIRVTLGFMDEEGLWNGADYFPMMIAPTFWQPLPKPPMPKEREQHGTVSKNTSD